MKLKGNFVIDSDKLQKLCKQMPLVEELYNGLLEQTSQKQDIRSLFSKLETILDSKQIPSAYFKDYFHRICYEMILGIYNESFIGVIACEKNKQKEHFNVRSAVQEYVNCLEEELVPNTIEEKISRYKGNQAEFWENPINQRTVSEKARTYFHYTFGAMSATTHECRTTLGEKDFVFNIVEYPWLVYYPENRNRGIQFCRKNEQIEEYLKLHKEGQSLTLEEEYSAYMFQYLHYSTQYHRCMSTLLKRPFMKKDLICKKELLYFYARLFDTHYLSLSEYIMKGYEDALDNLEKDNAREILRVCYLEFSYYNAILLPVLELIVREILFMWAKKDVIKVFHWVREYLLNLMALKENAGYSYREMLVNAYQDVKNLKYPSGKDLIKSDSTKSGTKENKFNTIISEVFFFQNTENLIEKFFLQTKNGREVINKTDLYNLFENLDDNFNLQYDILSQQNVFEL